ncbi:MAG TPA: DUF4357 domain-containing protein [Verrucomicrobiae bacterium]|jgi:hypothetical protein
MIRPSDNSRKWINVAAIVLLILVPSIPVNAGIAAGPFLTNSVAAERQRITQFQDAERSFQKKLQVGRERYDKKQADRAKVIESMTWQLQTRQQSVVMQQSEPDEENSGQGRPVVERTLHWIAGLALAGAFLFSVHRLNEIRVEDAWIRSRKPKLVPRVEVEDVQVPMEDETFFCSTSDANGMGRYTEHGFVILKGSTGPNGNVSVNSKSHDFRKRLLETGVILEKGATVEFQVDYLFPTPTLAVAALTGGVANGWLEWKTKDGKTLETMERLRTRTSAVSSLASPVICKV